MWDSPPLRRPIGERTASTITTSARRCSMTSGVRRRRRRGEFVADYPAEDLAGVALRQLGADLQRPRPRSGRQPLGAERQQLLGRDLGAQRDDGVDALAPAVVGDADGGRLAHRRVGEQHVLDLAGIDVVPAAHHHVALAVDDREEAVVVDDTDVTGVHPPAADRPCRRLGILPVLAHQTAAARDDLADLAGPSGWSSSSQIAASTSVNGRPHDPCRSSVWSSGSSRVIAIGASAWPYTWARTGPKRVDRAVADGRGDRRRAVAQSGQRAIEVVDVGLVEHHRDHRRHEERALRPVTVDQRHRGAGVERRQDHLCRSVHEVGQDERPAGVGDRRGVEHHVAGRDARHEVGQERRQLEQLATRSSARPPSTAPSCHP